MTMGKRNEKQIEKLSDLSRSISFREVESILLSLGFQELSKVKTSGSRVRFFRPEDNAVIDLHVPHPGNEIKRYMRDLIIMKLKEYGDL